MCILAILVETIGFLVQDDGLWQLRPLGGPLLLRTQPRGAQRPRISAFTRSLMSLSPRQRSTGSGGYRASERHTTVASAVTDVAARAPAGNLVCVWRRCPCRCHLTVKQ